MGRDTLELLATLGCVGVMVLLALGVGIIKVMAYYNIATG